MQHCSLQQTDWRAAWPRVLACALLGFWMTNAGVLAQDADFDTWRPDVPETLAPDRWLEPPNALPLSPEDLPPIVARPPAWDMEPAHALISHQEPLPRPEHPPLPAPLPEGVVLEPVPEGMYFPIPSCAQQAGCGLCGGCQNCEPCVAHTRAGRFACALYHAVCCPDPCYEPQWIGVANAAFWVDGVRPVTQVRYRWDAFLNMVHPDRATYIWPRVGALGPAEAPRTLDLHELSMTNEVASGNFSFFINTPYRSYDTDLGTHGAGFGDLDMGTKSVLFDCELLQVAFQFRTFVPVGVGMKGLGTGHVSLEPSILLALNLAPDTYLQAQLSEWIPISSDSGAGAILHYHASLNHVLFRWQPGVPIIGTLEASGWSFQDGSYTDALGVVHPASGTTYVSAGPGVRVVVCDKVDFGIGTAFAMTQDHWGEQMVRSEFRWRF